MNKKELIESISEKADLTKDEASSALEALVSTVVSSLKKGESVRIVGFGNFEMTRRKASMGRNPRTGDPVRIPASNVPKFKAGKALKDAIN